MAEVLRHVVSNSRPAPPPPTHKFFTPLTHIQRWAWRQGPVSDLLGEVRQVTTCSLAPHLHPFFFFPAKEQPGPFSLGQQGSGKVKLDSSQQIQQCFLLAQT